MTGPTSAVTASSRSRRQWFALLAAVMVVITLGQVCQASTVFTDISLIRASEGSDFHSYSANAVIISDHHVFFDRLGDYAKSELEIFCKKTDFLNPSEVSRLLREKRGPEVWYLLNFSLWWKEYIA